MASFLVSSAFSINWSICSSDVSFGDVNARDLFPTLAQFAGGNVPEDHPIDGLDMSDFFWGTTDPSGRDGFVVYMGNDVFGVKWKNGKLHFKEQNAWNSVLREYTMPRGDHLMNDPQERDNVFFRIPGSQRRHSRNWQNTWLRSKNIDRCQASNWIHTTPGIKTEDGS